jgi:hypothetical protein
MTMFDMSSQQWKYQISKSKLKSRAKPFVYVNIKMTTSDIKQMRRRRSSYKRSAEGGRLRIALEDHKFRNTYRTQPTSKIHPIAVYFDRPLSLDSRQTSVSLLIRLAFCQSPLDHRLESRCLIGSCFFPTQTPTSISVLAFSNVPTPCFCSLLQGSHSQVGQFDLDQKVISGH